MNSTAPRPSCRLSAALSSLLRGESAGGVLLLLCAAIAMAIANSALSGGYAHLLHTPLTLFGLTLSLHHWINDGLMAIFFLVVGMEIKRECLFGELRSPSAALLPIAAALGGMVVPALIYWACNAGRPTLSGWAIPMSTDIAFSLGVLAFAARGAPKSVAVFLTALAIVDDLGGIAVLALFYGSAPNPLPLGGAAVVAALLFLAARRGLTHPLLYLAGGILLWIAFFYGGIHPTVAGVATGFLIPGGTEETEASAPLSRWVHALSPWNAFLIMPVFALANAGIPLSGDSFSALLSPVGLGVMGGLFLGKPLGICFMVWLLIRLGLSHMPAGVRPAHFLGAGLLAGIGFTMALFLAALSFTSEADLITAKAAIVAASILSGTAGTVLFSLDRRRSRASS